MPTINTEPNQTLLDLALQLYGNLDAIAELLELNPGIMPVSFAPYDPEEYSPEDYDTELQAPADGEVDIAYPLAAGTSIIFDTTSPLRNATVLRELALLATFN